MLNSKQKFLKRFFDLVLSIIGIAATFWLIALGWLLASLSTGSNGFFLQERVGVRGRTFKVIKLKTMRPVPQQKTTTVTTVNDARITSTGQILRKTKIDELPQLFNVLVGQMSFVGPRPDVPGFADKLQGGERVILELRPGITGPSSLKYRDEEIILAKVEDPEEYNASVIWPDKVKINIAYANSWSMRKDIFYIFATVFPFLKDKPHS